MATKAYPRHVFGTINLKIIWYLDPHPPWKLATTSATEGRAKASVGDTQGEELRWSSGLYPWAVVPPGLVAWEILASRARKLYKARLMLLFTHSNNGRDADMMPPRRKDGKDQTVLQSEVGPCC